MYGRGDLWDSKTTGRHWLKKLPTLFEPVTSWTSDVNPPVSLNKKIPKSLRPFIIPLKGRELKPVVTCEEVAGFELILYEEATSSKEIKTFSATIHATDFDTSSGSFTLKLLPKIGFTPVASTVFHIFDKAEVSDAEAELD